MERKELIIKINQKLAKYGMILNGTSDEALHRVQADLLEVALSEISELHAIYVAG